MLMKIKDFGQAGFSRRASRSIDNRFHIPVQCPRFKSDLSGRELTNLHALLLSPSTVPQRLENKCGFIRPTKPFLTAKLQGITWDTKQLRNQNS
jgi:hypothetical protein